MTSGARFLLLGMAVGAGGPASPQLSGGTTGVATAPVTRARDSAVMALVRETIVREVTAANAGGHIMYRRTSVSPQGSEARDIIETRDWTIGRLVRMDGASLTPAREREEIDRLAALRSDSAALRALAASLYRDEERVRRIMVVMPDAFEFTLAGRDTGVTGRAGLRLAFRPRDGFVPPSRETALLTGLEGTMVIDTVAHRVTGIEATLTRDVSFGWGLLGRLNRGGHAVIRQRNVAGGRWAITTLQLHFDGNAFFVRRIRIRTDATSADFVPMDDRLTLEQGIARLLASGRPAGAR
ncbi:MAG: hypothetical protein U9Q74_11555 [Gemmatimonadota bacterium]|nr:hypothetical protein [Gemmatimonadota bacterium]